MKNMKFPSFFAFSLLIVSLFWAGCAIQSYPTGGKADDTPPAVRQAKPDNQSRNYAQKEVVLHFDSYPKAGITYGKEVFISPILTKEPKIFIMDKSLHVKFQEDLKANTTYVITLSDISDHFSGQKMTTPYIYAFSTGAILDTMKITGNVISGFSGAGEKDFRVLLFDADSVKTNMDIWKKRPEYISKTDDNGNFTLSNLKKKPYKIYAIKDGDQSNTYNQKTEAIAIDTTALVVFPDSSRSSEIKKNLISFLPDEQAPRVKGYEWAGEEGLAIEVSETVRMDSLIIEVSDTLGTDKQRITNAHLIAKDKKYVYFFSPRNRELISQIYFKNLVDSLGNHTDTTFRVYSKALMSSKDAPFFQKPAYNNETQQVEWLFGSIPKDTLENFISLADSAGKKYPIVLSRKVETGILQMEAPANIKQKFTLNFKGEAFGLKDSTIKFPLQYPDEKLFGKISGNLVTEGYEGKIVWILSAGGGGGSKDRNASTGGGKYILYKRDFDLKWMPPGNYTAKVIFDTDGNGTWTPGSLGQNRLPERIFSVKEVINVKANWELTKLEILAPFVLSNTSMKGSAKKDEGKGKGEK